jgi:hypothetical protein
MSGLGPRQAEVLPLIREFKDGRIVRTFVALPFSGIRTAQKIGSSAQINTRLLDGSKSDSERARRFLL